MMSEQAKRSQRTWLLVAALAGLALLCAFLVSIFFPLGGDAALVQFGRRGVEVTTPFAGGPPPMLTPPGEQPDFPRNRQGVFFIQQLSGFYRYLAQLVVLLGAALLAFFFVPRQVGAGAAILRSGPAYLLRALLVGFLSLLATVALSYLSAISTIGPAIIILALIVLLPALLVGACVVALAIGRSLAASIGAPLAQPLPDLLAGLLVLFMISLIPYAGPPLGLLIILSGLGGLLLSLRDDRRTALDELDY